MKYLYHIADMLINKLSKQSDIEFTRDLDGIELIKKSMEKKLDNMLENAGKKSNRQIAEEDVFDVFGI